MTTAKEAKDIPSIDSDLLLPYLDSLYKELSEKDSQEEIFTGESGTDVAPINSQANVVIEIEDANDSQPETSTRSVPELRNEDAEVCGVSPKLSYLNDHLEMMYYVGLYRSSEKQLSWKSVIHLGAFVVTTALSLMQGLGATKHYILNYAKRGSVYHYITVWYYLHSVLVSLHFLKLVVSNKITSFLKHMKGDADADSCDTETQIASRKMSKFVIFLAITSILAPGYDAFGLNFLTDGSHLKTVIEVKSIHFRKNILIWSNKNYTDNVANLRDEILGTGYTTGNVAMGFFEILLEYVGWVQYYMIRDVMLMAALTLYSHAEVYKAFLKSVGSLDSSAMEKMWDKYNILYKLSSEMEACFGSFFQLVHIDNWLFCAYFLLNSLEDDTEIDADFVTNLALVMKIVATYCLAAVANNVGTQFKRRLNSMSMGANHASSADVTEMKISIIYLEQKINNSPVGLGSGNFLITENYAYKFTGSVVSSFLFFMDSQRKSEGS